MKTYKNIALFAVLLLFLSMPGLLAQEMQEKPDQQELIKKFEGTWKADLGGGAIFVGENTIFGTGMISKSHVQVSGDTVESIHQLYGYDKELDKYILAELVRSSAVIELCHVWFVSPGKGIIEVVNPADSPYEWTFEFLSNKELKQTARINGEEANSIVLKKIN